MAKQQTGTIVNKFQNPSSCGGGLFIVLQYPKKHKTIQLEISEKDYNLIKRSDKVKVRIKPFKQQAKLLSIGGVNYG